jgi:hypothetical protein
MRVGDLVIDEPFERLYINQPKRGAPIIVPTDLAVVWLIREGVTKAQARRFIYDNSARGNLTNYGNSHWGMARWDLRQIRALMWPKDLDAHPLT